MKRTNTTDGGLESYPSSLKYKQQQALSPQQQKQIQAQQHIQQQQYQAQQQQQLQIQQQIQGFQQHQQQQQMHEYQKQQQFAANQQFYNQAAFYNYQPYVPPQSPLMYNNRPPWNFISTPPPFYGSKPPSSTPQPPLPPPELKPEKPPLPREPEPGNENQTGHRAGGSGTFNLSGAGISGLNGPRMQGGIRVRGLNGINAGMFNGMNGSVRLNGPTAGMPGSNQRRRRNNPHFFSQMQPPSAAPAQDLPRDGDVGDLAQLLDEDIPAGTEKCTIFLNNSENGRVQVNKKAKRKPMSTRYTRTKQWVREEAEAALALEKEFNRMQKRPMLILKFPDPDLNKFIVKKYSPFIDTVHFQQPSTPRYCFVQLKEDADVEKVVNTIRQIPFGTGTINAEIKSQHVDDQPVTPEEIDPYTLYIGNLPTHISVRVVKQYFPNAQRIDIGYAQRMRYTRYAFIRYSTVAEAMESYRKTVNALLDSRSLIVRFRRQKGNIGLPGEPKLKLQKRDDKEEDAAKDLTAIDNTSYTLPDDLTEEEEDEGEKSSKNHQEDIRILGSMSKHLSPSESVESYNTTGLNNDGRDLTKPSGHKEMLGQKQISSAETQDTAVIHSPISLSDDVDNKDKVLEEARELMKQNNDRRVVSPINFSAFAEPTSLIKGPVEGDIKLEQTDDDDSSDDGGINLLGTRVKDEPFETPHRGPMDELYYDDYDYDDLCTDIEDDDDNWSTNSDSRSRQLLTTNWEILRRTELNAREDKPDLNELERIDADKITETVALVKSNLEPKKETDDSDQHAAKKTKRDQLAVKQELEDMFNRLNSDVECDDDDAFFGHT